MAGARVGVDIGSRCVHMAVWRGGRLRLAVSEPLDEGLVREGRIVSRVAMGDLLRRMRRTAGVRGSAAALVLHASECFCRRTETPLMTPRQLRVNLPYEFRDFISDGKEKYFYDYAVLRRTDAAAGDGGEGVPGKLELMAAAVPKETIACYREVLRRAGMNLALAVPEEMAWRNLLRSSSVGEGSHCVLDLGSAGVRIHMFLGADYHSGRSLDYGCAALDEAIARELHVDPFTAASYRASNYENCQELPACRELYGAMALEVMKAVNYFNFSTPDHPLEKVRCCGGGAAVAPLVKTLRETLPVPVEDCASLLPGGEGAGDVSLTALGAAMQRR